MLTFVDVPQYLTALDQESRRCGVELAQGLGEALSGVMFAAHSDLTVADAPTWIHVESGCLRWQEGTRLVRMYNDGDWLLAGPDGAGQGASVTSEFTTTARTIDRAAFEQRLRDDPALYGLWEDYRQSQQRILLGLAGVLARDDLSPNTRLQRFQNDQVIVTEGSPANEVFVMLEGAASVRVQGRAVGTIAEGEVFGEISFLTGQPRSASVIATGPCLVQVIEREQFAVMVRANPQLMVHVATTLASRVVDLNSKLHAGR